MRLRTASVALLTWLVSVSMRLPHGAETARKRPAPVPPGSLPQHQPGQRGARGQRPTTMPAPRAARLLGLGLGGIVALEWRRRTHVVQP
jgi:hypothetical protein